MAEIKSHQINVFVLGRNQTAIPGAKVVAYDGEKGVGGAIMGGSALAPARITLSEEYESVKLVASVDGHGSKEATVNADVGNFYFEFKDVVVPANQSTPTSASPSPPLPADHEQTGGSMSTQTRASWIFGSLFAAFVLGVFMFGPSTLPDYKQRILAYVCALLAGLFALFFTGSLLLKAELPLAGKWAVQGGAGFALFVIVLFWWSGGLAPVKSTKSDSITTAKIDGSPPQASQTPPPTLRTLPTQPPAQDQKKPPRIVFQKTGDIYVDRIREKIVKGEADTNWSEAERASALEGLFERGAFSCASTESWPEMFWAVAATRLVLQENLPAFQQHPASRNALNRASGILLRMEHDIAPLWGDSFDPTAALHAYAGNHDAFVHHLPAMVTNPDGALEAKRKQNVGALRSALKGVVPLADDDQCQTAAVEVSPPVDPQTASLSLEYDSLKQRYSAVNQSLARRGKDLGDLPLKPEITAALGTTKADLGAIEQALEGHNWNVASQRIDRVKKALTYLESL